MVRLLNTLLLALAVTLCLGQSVNGDTLRSLINARLEAEASNGNHADKKKKGGLICKSDTKKTDDRECEPQDGTAIKSVQEGTCYDTLIYQEKSKARARAAECTQQCHVYGDPHVHPYINSCRMDGVLSKAGIYTFLKVKQGKKSHLVEVKVEAKKGGHYIVAVKVDGKWEMNVSDFSSKKECNEAEYSEKKMCITLKSDNKSDPILHELYMNCRVKNGVKQLELLSTMFDFGAEEVSAEKRAAARSSSSSDALAYFTNPKGVCVDWTDPEYGGVGNNKFNCKDNAINKSKKEQDGRRCKYAAECAAWGDPHFSDFARDTDKHFKIPDRKDMNVSDHVAYSFQNLFAVFFDVDGCEFVSQIEVWMLKDEFKTKHATCDSDNGNDSFVEADKNHYKIINVHAMDFCEGKASDGEKREKLRIPHPTKEEFGAEQYDHFSQAYDLNYFAHTTSNSLLVMPPDVQNNNTAVMQCVKDVNGEKVDLKTAMGSVYVILKCHQRPDGYYYFNLCINRKGMELEEIVKAKSEANLNQFGDVTKAFLKAEKTAQSAGWCATGDYESNASKQAPPGTSSATLPYEQRKVGETKPHIALDENAVALLHLN